MKNGPNYGAAGTVSILFVLMVNIKNTIEGESVTWLHLFSLYSSAVALALTIHAWLESRRS